MKISILGGLQLGPWEAVLYYGMLAGLALSCVALALMALAQVGRALLTMLDLKEGGD